VSAWYAIGFEPQWKPQCEAAVEQGTSMVSRIRNYVTVALCAGLVACTSSEETANKGARPIPEHGDHPAVPSTGALPKPVLPPAGARVSFVEPQDGAEVSGPETDGKVAVHVKMGVEGIEVKPAGAQVDGTGHHHIIVDGAGVPLGDVVPKNDTHLHFGQGQTETDVLLTPGEHTLTLQFADGLHLSYGPLLTSSIKIKVVGKPSAEPAKAP
jgi:hypothetical protein